MIVAGIDASLTRTGIAVINNGQPTALHSIGWGTGDAKDDLDRNRRVRALATDVCAFVRKHHPDVLAIEKPLTFKPSGYAYDRFFLCQMIVAQFDIWRVPTVQIHNKKRPTWALGVNCPADSQTTKKLILAQTRAWYPHLRILNDDIADALVISLMTGHHYGEPMPFEAKPRHATTLDGIKWPVMA